MQNTEDPPKSMLFKENFSVLSFANASKQNKTPKCGSTRTDKRADNVEAAIHSRYYESFQTDLKKHNEQKPEIRFVQIPHRNHDRFLIIDDTVYLLGASLKDMGCGLCAITKLIVSPEEILTMLK